MRYVVLAFLGLLVCACSGVQAQNLVTNPGFETGDFTGWTVAGNIYSVETGLGHTGLYAASFGDSPPDVDDLSQTLATQSGSQYTLTFFAQTPAVVSPGTPNALSVYFDGNLIAGPLEVPDNLGYEQYSYTVTAMSSASVLRFVISNVPDYTQLDDISVTLIPPAAVPEPGSIALLVGMGISGSVFVCRRKQARQAA